MCIWWCHRGAGACILGAVGTGSWGSRRLGDNWVCLSPRSLGSVRLRVGVHGVRLRVFARILKRQISQGVRSGESGLGSRTLGQGTGPAAGPSGDSVLHADSLRVREDEDNGAVLQSARDALKLIRNKFLPAVCTWLQVGESLSRQRGRRGQCVGAGLPGDTPLGGSSSPAQGLRAGT